MLQFSFLNEYKHSAELQTITARRHSSDKQNIFLIIHLIVLFTDLCLWNGTCLGILNNTNNNNNSSTFHFTERNSDIPKGS